jgi:hypothetical protein
MNDQSNHHYQAIAILQGTLSLDETRSTLTVGESVFPAFVSKTVCKKHLPGQKQNFRAYPCIRHKQAAFQLVNVVDTPPTPITLNGCWELHKGKPYFVIYRNEILSPSRHPLHSFVPVYWQDAPPADGQFWQAEAEIREGEFTITKAEGPYPPPPKATKYIPPEPTKAEAAAVVPVPPALPLTAQEIRDMATAAKISLTCKLNQVPKHRELLDKRIEFFLQDGESDCIFTVQLKPKLFKKLTEHGFADWVAAVTGEIGPVTETGFELVNASVQVFEKRARDADSGVEAKASAEANSAAEPKAKAEPKPAAAQPEKGAAEAGKGQAKEDVGEKPKKKGLLDGVKLH